MFPPQRDSLIRSVAEQVSSRRGFLADTYAGLLGIGLLSLLQRDLSADDSPVATTGPDASWQPGKGLSHFPAKAQRVLQIFCPGAASHMDLWEYKPDLEKWDGKPLPGAENFVIVPGQERQSDAESLAVRARRHKRQDDFQPAASHGGRTWIDIAFIHSMTSKTNTHGPGCVFMNTGHVTEGLSQRRRMDQLRPGQCERKPADLRRHARHPRANRPTARRTGAMGFCPPDIRRSR